MAPQVRFRIRQDPNHSEEYFQSKIKLSPGISVISQALGLDTTSKFWSEKQKPTILKILKDTALIKVRNLAESNAKRLLEETVNIFIRDRCDVEGSMSPPHLQLCLKYLFQHVKQKSSTKSSKPRKRKSPATQRPVPHASPKSSRPQQNSSYPTSSTFPPPSFKSHQSVGLAQTPLLVTGRTPGVFQAKFAMLPRDILKASSQNTQTADLKVTDLCWEQFKTFCESKRMIWGENTRIKCEIGPKCGVTVENQKDFETVLQIAFEKDPTEINFKTFT